jgi:phenylpropionate dioxygenase-like ring-hydroxylating dioxygenase large terminal subunit
MDEPLPRVPSAEEFPAYPISWYLFGRSRELRHGPVSREMLGRRVVAFRTAGGRVAVLDGRCSHLGADLGKGCVVGEAIQCPFHHWEYGPDGRCRHIPVTANIPVTARQAVFPAVERHGCIFFFNGPQALFPLPFFPDVGPTDFVAARPFGAVLDCPWYMVGSNAFDLQHFRAAHDRRLASDPEVTCPHAFARRASARFRVAGGSLQDRLTRLFAGPEVEMAITDWCGNLMFATATFRRTTSYGMVVTEPLACGKVAVRVIVFLPRSRSPVGRLLADPLRLAVRRLFIKRFLASDASRLNSARFSPHGLIDCDRDLAEYFAWLAGVARGVPHQPAAPMMEPPQRTPQSVAAR